MDPEAQRIAIAETCGWTSIAHDMLYWHFAGRLDVHDGCLCGRMDGRYSFLPDYLNDLNAMDEAEAFLDLKQRHRWVEEVGRVLGLSQVAYDDDMSRWKYAHATAAQRAEAFLRTLGRWEGAT